VNHYWITDQLIRQKYRRIRLAGRNRRHGWR